jgi:AmmeMemoRadiSam system protein B
MAMVRHPLVAGMFYPHHPHALQQQLEWCFRHKLGYGALPKVNEQGRRRIVGLVVPHAGYIYSGMTASRAYAALADDGIPQVAILFAPAHYRPGAPFAVWTKGIWETPLGQVKVAEELAQALVAADEGYAEDFNPHLGGFGHGEHSIEVQLPFLQFVFGDRTPAIVPIAVSCHELDELKRAGQVLAEVVRQQNGDVVLIASCDFTHYEPHVVAERHDRETLERLTALDADGVWDCVRRYPSQSDVLVAIPVVEAAKGLGATEGIILGYSTSGQVTGDLSEVVGYGAAALLRP